MHLINPSVNQMTHPSIYPSIHPKMNQFIHASIHLSTYPLIHSLLYPSLIHPFIYLLIFHSIQSLSNHPLIHLFIIYLSIHHLYPPTIHSPNCLSMCSSIYPPVHPSIPLATDLLSTHPIPFFPNIFWPHPGLDSADV